MTITNTFGAGVENWSKMALENATYVVRDTIQDVAEMMSVGKDGLVRGAPFEQGVVPVDEGELIGSLRVWVGDQLTGQGDPGSAQPPDYAAALLGFELGEEVVIGFTADHARPIEYGFRISATADDTDDLTGDVDVPGRFMVWSALQNWQAALDENARAY